MAKFDEKNQPEERKPRGKGKKTLMLDAIRAQCGSEEEFLEQVVKTALKGNRGKPNVSLLMMVLQRIEPPYKPVTQPVKFDFDENATPLVKANQILKAASQGIIPPEVAKLFIESIGTVMKIEEITELADRITKLEELQDE